MSGWDACTMEPSAVLRWIECHPSTAAWLQGFSTIVAIAVAIGVPLMIERAKQHTRARRTSKIVLAVAESAWTLLDEANAAAKSNETAVDYSGRYNKILWRTAGDAIAAIPISDLPSGEMAAPFLAFRTAIEESVQQLELAWNLMIQPPERSSPILYWRSGLTHLRDRHSRAAVALAQIQEAVKRVGGR